MNSVHLQSQLCIEIPESFVIEEENPQEQPSVWQVANVQPPILPFCGCIDILPPQFNNHLCLYNFPNIGHYNPEGYKVAIPLFFLKGKTQKAKLDLILPTIQASLQELPLAEIECYLAIHDIQPVITSLTDSHTEKQIHLNMLYHCWCFPEIQSHQSENITMRMGIWEEQIGEDKLLHNGPEGIVNTFSCQSVNPHPSDAISMCCSPNNARFYLNSGITMVAFWSLGIWENKGILGLQILLNDSSLSQEWENKMQKAENLKELFHESENFLNIPPSLLEKCKEFIMSLS